MERCPSLSRKGLHSNWLSFKKTDGNNEEAEQASKARKESEEKQKTEENVRANVQAAQAAAEAVPETPFTKQTSSATSRKQKIPAQKLVAGVQGEGFGKYCVKPEMF